MTSSDWKNSWEKFVAHVAGLHIFGRDDAEIAELLAGARVCWSGKIASVGVDDEYAKGAQIYMPEARVPLRGRKILVGSFVGLQSDRKDDADWRAFSQGDPVTFEGKLVASIGPFPGIRVSYDDIDDDVILMVAVREGRPFSYGRS
jgi:hypothetical protein